LSHAGRVLRKPVMEPALSAIIAFTLTLMTI
jgi:hypothetical protein